VKTKNGNHIEQYAQLKIMYDLRFGETSSAEIIIVMWDEMNDIYP
jgi:hypothetical protein